MANQTITQLPDAGPITGTELVPIVQNGGTYKTTTAAISASPSQSQTFLTKNLESTLPNSRFLSSGTGIGLVDGGAQSFYRITLNGVSGTLESMGNGFGVKIGGTMTARSITYSGSGITVTNGDGQSGNPTVSLDGTVASLANNGGTGFLALPGNGSVAGRTLTGTANQIGITNPNGIADSPVFSIADNPVLPGDGGVVVPVGDTAARPAVPTNGTFRYNNQTGTFEGYASGNWGAVVTGTGVTSVGLVMPSDFLVTNSPITSAGDLTASYVSQTANYVFAAPNGSSGTPAFRAFVNADLPNSGVTANTYGSTTAIPVITVNAKGIITGVTTAAITGGLVFQGSWDAATNTPALASGVGTNGFYYVVSVAGSTNLDGITDWQIGDWAIFNGTTWQKIDQTNLVSSVNGQVGAVSIAYADLAGAIPTWNQNTTGNAATATNVAGGAANKIVYNTGTSTTAFIDAPVTAGHYLKWTGSAFEWNVAGTGTVTSVDVSGGTTGLTTSGGPVTASGTITLAGTLITSNGGTGLTTYTAGDLTYYASGTALSKLAIGSANSVLTSSGTAPQWSTSLTGLTSVSSTSFTENGYAVVSQSDIGTAPNEIPLNQYLGDLAYQDAANIAGNLRAGGTITAVGGISGGTF